MQLTFRLNKKLKCPIDSFSFSLEYQSSIKTFFVSVQCTYFGIFRAIFDLSNKIALLILLRMYALYVKKSNLVMTKFEIVSKELVYSTYIASAR